MVAEAPVPNFRPNALVAPEIPAVELWEHTGSWQDRAFGRLVHGVLQFALSERLKDSGSARLYKKMKELEKRAAYTRDESAANLLRKQLRTTRRELCTREMKRMEKFLDERWAVEGHNLHNSERQKQRAFNNLKRYVESDDYIDANVWQYSIFTNEGETTKAILVPMLEFKFFVKGNQDVPLVGRFDRVDERDGHPVVIDYKTSPPRPMFQLRRDNQVLLYAAAIADLTGIKTVEIEMHWLEAGTKTVMMFRGTELERAKRQAAAYCKQREATASDLIAAKHPVTRSTRAGRGPLAA